MFILNQMYAKANTARSAAKGKACTVRVAADMVVVVGTMVGAMVGTVVGTMVGAGVGQKPPGYTYGSYAGSSKVTEPSSSSPLQHRPRAPHRAGPRIQPRYGPWLTC